MNLPLDEKIVDELKAIAKKAGRPVEELAGEALLDFLEKEKRRQVVERGRADLQAGRTVDADAMDRWLDSWGSEDETDPPQCQS